MPKTYPKTHPKKTKPKKNQPKAQSKPFSLMKSKTYWITVALIILIFTVAYGYFMQISVGKELLILGSVFSVMGFAFYIGFIPCASYNKRVTFFFVGASIVGFSIWAVMVLFFNATGIITQISSSIGIDFFAITSLIICLVLGAFIGDLIGKNREAVGLFAHKFRN